ncbi:peptide/nickel transport system substrate-binding protein [Rhodoligotrophos appendicifer]|uniref:ABC transporter substrate-binding protein n=1 Tax=Rhodoligotrophos appendicifer TaxID=987056 RepID=UPI0011849A0F|nr:ABC transporter substrate-binding protein [Rhodoligotrophos appendicifer]
MTDNLLMPGVSRRGFMVGAGAAGLALLPGSHLQAQESTPKRGGRFRLALAGGSTTDTFEPGSIWDSVIQNISAQVRDTLVDVMPDFSPGASLAESWEPSADFKTWKFNLRKGVQFHNGKSFTSEDVVFTINHHRGPNSISGAKSTVANVDDVKADGPNAVIFTLKVGSVDFPMSLSDYHLVIMQAGTTDWLTSVGTGPFALQSYQPGVRALTKRYENYWRTDRGFFDEVDTLVVNDSSARMNALVSGQVDAINRVDTKTAALVQRNPNLKLQNVQGTKQFTLPMLVDAVPFNNPDVRLALKYAINRQQIVDNVLQGFGQVGNDQPIAPVNRFFDPNLPIRAYDPDKAKFHMKKAGMEGHAFELNVSDAAFNGAVDACALYQESARQAGININLKRVPSDGYWSRIWMKVPWCVSFWSGRPTEDAILSICYEKGADSNETHWDNPQFNQLLVAARSEADDAKRRQMYYDIQALIRDDCGTVLPCFLNFVQATNSKIGTGKVAGNGEMDGDRCAERWWFV